MTNTTTKNGSDFKGSNTGRRTGLPVLALLYVTVVQLGGILLLGHAVREVLQQPDPRWFYLAVLAAMAGLFSVKLASGRERSGSVAMSPGDFFVFAGIALAGPAAGALMGALEGLMSSFRLRIRHWRKILFNVSQLVFSAYLAGSFYKWLQPVPYETSIGEIRTLLVAAIPCALIYFLANSLLVGLAMLLVSGRPTGSAIWKPLLWGLPANCVNACLVAIALAMANPLDVWVAAGLVSLIIVSYVLRGVHLASETREARNEIKGIFQVSFFDATVPLKARGYLYVVLALALPILLYCLHYSFSLPQSNWLYLAVLAAVAGWFPVRLLAVRDKMWLTLSDLFVFVALFQFGAEVAVVIAAVEALAFNLRNRPKAPYRWVYNVTQLVLTAFVVGQLFRFLEAVANVQHTVELGFSKLLPALSIPMFCGFLYFASTLTLTAGAMTLVTGQSFRQLFQQNVGWCTASVLAALAGASAYLLVQGFSLGL